MRTRRVFAGSVVARLVLAEFVEQICISRGVSQYLSAATRRIRWLSSTFPGAGWQCFTQTTSLPRLEVRRKRSEIRFWRTLMGVVALVSWVNSAGQMMQSFGNSILADIDGSGGVSILGKFRWTDDAVVRIEATLLSPMQFIIACRASKAVNEMDTSDVMRQEAMAVYGEMDGADLLFDPGHLNVEPEKEQV